MATEITPTVLNLNSYIDLSDTTGNLEAVTDISDGDGTDFKYSPEKDTRFLIYVETTDGTSNVDKVVVSAGDYFQNKILGDDNDLTVDGITLGEGNAVLIGPLESARFLNEDGEVEFTVTASAAAHDATVGVIEISYEES